MSVPNKRRKKNDHQASPRSVRSLDFFFGKQRGKDEVKREETTAPSSSAGGAVQDEHHVEGGVEDKELTDEQLARKLQAEWDEMDRMGSEARNCAPPTDAEPLREMKKEPPDKVEGCQDESVTVKSEPESIADNAPPSKPTINAFAAFGKKNTLSLQSAMADEDSTSYTLPFDQSPVTFDPKHYLPDLKKQWATEGGAATYALLTQCFVQINSTQSRIKIVDTLVNLLRTIIEGDPDSLLPTVWLATNSISPPYIDVELGLGGSAISKALKKVCGLDNAALKTLSNKYGDAGDVAFEAKKRQSLTLRKPKPLTIKSVYASLHMIAASKGPGSVEAKQRIVERLVQDARGAEESRYIVRTLVQHLRIGAVKTTMLIALSRAFLLSRPPGADFAIKPAAELGKLSKQALAELYSPGEELVKASFARRPNYNDLVPALLELGIDNELLIRCGLALHIPLRPMLGGITRDLGDMLTKLQGRDFACEFKYDGQRAQVHCDAKGKVTIFSRHLEVMTDKYPDLVALVPKIRGEGVSSFILEGEVVAIDRESGELKPFQILANRARKDVVIQSVKVDVCLFSFDLMYLNGEELLGRPFRERRSLLRSLFVEIPHHFTWVQSFDATSSEGEAVADFFKQATDIKCEGIMVKVLDNVLNPALQADVDIDILLDDRAAQPTKLPPTPTKPKQKRKKQSTAKTRGQPIANTAGDEANATTSADHTRRKALPSTYTPDKRLDAWLKVKKDYSLTADTLDLIPVGGWHGSGRKCNWWSPILLACRDEDTGTLQVVTKCMSGFTDAFYKANKEKYAEGGPNVISRPSYVEYGAAGADLAPAVWFEPQEVWEMAFADVTLSPTYTAAIGLVSEERGLSLRFPRFLRVREDKSLEEASTADFLAGLYRKQEARETAGRGKGAIGDVVDGEEDEE